MPKIPKCDRCSFYAHSPHLICAVHPDGADSDCLDFQDNGREAELWSPLGYVWHNGELLESRAQFIIQILAPYIAFIVFMGNNRLRKNKTFL